MTDGHTAVIAELQEIFEKYESGDICKVAAIRKTTLRVHQFVQDNQDHNYPDTLADPYLEQIELHDQKLIAAAARGRRGRERRRSRERDGDIDDDGEEERERRRP